MKLQEARKYAELELKKLEPFIVRGEIAGSIRRLKPDVKDIELVVIPITDLFDLARLPEGIFHYETIKNGEKYKQYRIFEGFNIDLFIVTPPADWGVIYTIRTGPWEFSKWIVTSKRFGGCMPDYAKVKDGAVWEIETEFDDKGDPIYIYKDKIPMPTEQHFLDFLDLGWIFPESRCKP